MGYHELAQSKARMAFRLIGNLAKVVTLQQTDISTFNFATGIKAPSATRTSSVKAVVTAKKREKGGSSSKAENNLSSTILGELLMLSEDIDDLTVYDKVIIDGATWNIVPPYADDGYTTIVNISREQGVK